MTKWPEEMLSPRFQPEDLVIVRRLKKPLMNYERGEEFDAVDNGDVGKVRGFKMLCPLYHGHNITNVYYDVWFENPASGKPTQQWISPINLYSLKGVG